MVKNPHPRNKAKPGPRAAALMLLRGVRDGASLADQADMLDSLPPADRARAQRLALTTLRHQGRADTLLAPHLHRAPRPDIRDILRLATVEMLELHEAPHGVVNAAVASARALGQKGQAASGMVNAVLRKLADAGEAWAALPPQRLPDWLRKPLLAAWGADAVAAIEAAHQAGAPLDLTAKTSFPPALAAMGETLPTGSLRLALTQVSTLPGFAEGDWWVQDAAAALAVRLLDPQPGEVIADLCAAPGGKTLQLAAAGAKVTALDLSADRLERLRQNLDRCGLTAEIITGDALDWHPDSPPDAILLDAPCSATGTIRRHPDLPLIRDGGALPAITALQTRLLDHAIARLPEGGRLVYATCSLLPDEGEDQITAALARHPDLTAEIPEAAWIEPGWRSAHGLRLRPDFWPERGGMDGFYLARLRKGGGRP